MFEHNTIKLTPIISSVHVYDLTWYLILEKVLTIVLTLWRPLLSYGYSSKASCAGLC